MGKRIVPPQDPERLARVMDERQRVIGVDVRHLQQQAEERQRREELEAKLHAEEDARQLLWAKKVEKAHFDAQLRRRAVAERVGVAQREQINDKTERDKKLKTKYENHVDEAFFDQFGASHR